MRCLDAELRKAHRRHDLLLCLLVPLIAIAWAGGTAPDSQEELAQGYISLFYSLPILHAILLPVTMALLASRLWDLEIKGCTRSLLYTLQSRRSLFTAKALLGLLEILLITLLELAAAVLLGKLYGYTDAIEPKQLVYLFLCTLSVDGMLFFLEFLVMLLSSGPLVALCVGIVGAMLGIFSAFLPQICSYFVVWGYYVPLSAYEIANWDEATHTVTYGFRGFQWGFLVFTAALGIALYFAARHCAQNQEV